MCRYVRNINLINDVVRTDAVVVGVKNAKKEIRVPKNFPNDVNIFKLLFILHKHYIYIKKLYAHLTWYTQPIDLRTINKYIKTTMRYYKSPFAKRQGMSHVNVCVHPRLGALEHVHKM